MIYKTLAPITLALVATAATAQEVIVPSGIDVQLYDVILEPATQTARFRFHAPDIGGENGVSFAQAVPDIQYLCDEIVVPGLAENGWMGGDVVISLSANKVAFGVAHPETIQYFQPFSIQAGACMWEDF
ncbi:hypothetical protein FHS72_000467 [Loktanella ponticola]|uniref:Acetolactate synthase n=1 Tax=Yoonia ponticola TaxID=1524255 RepID=A0A7W9EWQ7_9RHOB|nr:DUF6497 family protein [Yoonia ponticola]MBB5720863.1 hypothetical protein [Yoonia ponticola]